MTPRSEPSFVPISPNPFIVGNPVRNREMFFGREAEFEWVRKRFQARDSGSLLVLCGERRSGKTSILFQILDGRLGSEFIPVLIDMQSMAVENEAAFLARISQEILATLKHRPDLSRLLAGSKPASLELPDYQSLPKPSAAFQSFVETVVSSCPGHRLVLLFDEYELFENKIESTTLSDDVIHILASLVEYRSIFVIFTGSQNLEERRREYWGILRKSLHRTISYLQRSDAVSLITRPVESRVTYEDGVVDGIIRLTAGQPFYTQAVCQNLIDHLNEEKTTRAHPTALDEVVRNIVGTPLPQMIFLWDGLGLEEKLVLALLGETLKGPEEYARVRDLAGTLQAGKYPLDLSSARMATSLEKLFKQELLLKDTRNVPGYAFRMDLWRLWIRRMHSVWQVMREEGIEIRKRRTSLPRPMLYVTSAVVLVAAALLLPGVFKPRANPPPGGTQGTPPPPATARFSLSAGPGSPDIYIDGNKVAEAYYAGPLEPSRPHEIRIVAAGYADSAFSRTLASGASDIVHVDLRPLVGSVEVRTNPPSEFVVDGTSRGRSPGVVHGLPVPSKHRVSATRPDGATLQTEFNVVADSTVAVFLDFLAEKYPLLVSSSPTGASIKVDGQAVGSAKSPVSIMISMGRHTITAELDGYIAESVEVNAVGNMPPVHFSLKPLPPGQLQIMGDVLAVILIDGKLIIEDAYNSGPQSLPEGSYAVRVEFNTGAAVDTTLFVSSGKQVVFNYSSRSVIERPLSPGD